VPSAAKGSRQRIKKKSNSHIETFSSSTYTPKKAYAQISHKNKYLFYI
jgi:hypothetical protein